PRSARPAPTAPPAAAAAPPNRMNASTPARCRSAASHVGRARLGPRWYRRRRWPPAYAGPPRAGCHRVRTGPPPPGSARRAPRGGQTLGACRTGTGRLRRPGGPAGGTLGEYLSLAFRAHGEGGLGVLRLRRRHLAVDVCGDSRAQVTHPVASAGAGSAAVSDCGERWARACRSWARPRWLRERSVPIDTSSVPANSSYEIHSISHRTTAPRDWGFKASSATCTSGSRCPCSYWRSGEVLSLLAAIRSAAGPRASNRMRFLRRCPSKNRFVVM